MSTLEQRSVHPQDCPARFQEYSLSDCTCGAYIDIRQMGVLRESGRRQEWELSEFDATTGIALHLKDGRVVSIGDFGNGPVVQVQGPDSETLAEWSLPRAGDKPADRIWCALRGRGVPETECVSSCPAPEQRVVCAMGSLDPQRWLREDPRSGLEQYQAEDR